MSKKHTVDKQSKLDTVAVAQTDKAQVLPRFTLKELFTSLSVSPRFVCVKLTANDLACPACMPNGLYVLQIF